MEKEENPTNSIYISTISNIRTSLKSSEDFLCSFIKHESNYRLNLRTY
jgi:hypothetical protein